MKLCFILDKPARAANVGAVARAMHTMGFADLRLVASQVHRDEEAEWVAHGSQHLLQQARVFRSIDEAIADCDLVVATTARKRGEQRLMHSPEALCEQLKQRSGTVSQVGLLFGCEASGLCNEALKKADMLSYIPLATEFPSLNLAQACMVYSYACSSLVNSATSRPDRGINGSGSYRALRQRFNQLVDGTPAQDDEKLQAWLNEKLGTFSDRDVAMCHTLLNDLNQRK